VLATIGQAVGHRRGAFLALVVLAAGCGDPAGGFIPQEGNPCGPTTPVVDYVVDGDTVRLKDPDVYVRFLGIDTPELHSGSSESRALGQHAKETLMALVAPGATVGLEYEWQGGGETGQRVTGCTDFMPGKKRLLAYVWVNGEMLNKYQLAQGNACCFVTADKPRYRDALSAAELSAQKAHRGVWKSLWASDNDTCSTKYRSSNICRNGR